MLHKNKKPLKKSQMEIMGLAIVVILLVVGMTFVIRFMLSKEAVDYKKQFSQAEIATNTLNTFLRMDSDECSGLSMTELLQDCSYNGNILCENNMNSCEYANKTAILVFNQTLDVWNMAYEFRAYKDSKNPLMTHGKPCPGSKKSKTFPIPTSSGTLFVSMDVCG